MVDRLHVWLLRARHVHVLHMSYYLYRTHLSLHASENHIICNTGAWYRMVKLRRKTLKNDNFIVLQYTYVAIMMGIQNSL